MHYKYLFKLPQRKGHQNSQHFENRKHDALSIYMLFIVNTFLHLYIYILQQLHMYMFNTGSQRRTSIEQVRRHRKHKQKSVTKVLLQVNNCNTKPQPWHATPVPAQRYHTATVPLMRSLLGDKYTSIIVDNDQYIIIVY